MTQPGKNEDLKRIFVELREQDAADTPDFESVMSLAHSGPQSTTVSESAVRWLAAASIALTIAAVGYWLISSSTPPADATLESWRSPTNSLAETTVGTAEPLVLSFEIPAFAMSDWQAPSDFLLRFGVNETRGKSLE